MDPDDIIEDILKREGGYVNNPDDLGGETNWGITVAVARANGYTGPMVNLTRDQARAIYRRQYIEAPKFHQVAVYSPELAARLVDIGVNMGPATATKLLQRMLNVFNYKGQHYADIGVDGKIGPATMRALAAFTKRRGNPGLETLLVGVNCLQGARYVELSERREANESFTYGWLKRLAEQA